jgi:hypothetical protein
MAKLTWLGEDELHGDMPGPSFTTAFGGIKFPKGQSVEVMDKAIIARARNNQYFEVTGVPGRPPNALKADEPADV